MRQNESGGRHLGYYIKEGINSIFAHGLMSLASVCVIIACLLIMGSFTMLAVNVDAIIGTLEDENQIVAYVDDSLSETEARALQSAVEAVPNVASAQFVSRESAMDSFVQTYEDPSIFDGLDASVFRHRFVLTLDDLSLTESTENELMGIDGIGDVKAHLEISRGFVKTRNVVTAVSVVLIVMLFTISLFIMANTINLTVFERREEIAIMKMVGATSGFIRWPFVVDGLILGVFGALSAYLIQWGIYTFVMGKLVADSGLSFITLLPFKAIAIPLLLIFLGVGFGVGVIGSAIALRKYLKV